MISGLVPFAEIVENVKDETGIQNLRPLYDRIRRLIFRAERDIGYGGSIILKKKIYKPEVDYNGTYMKFPLDFIEFEGIGQDCLPVYDTEYTATSEGIRFKRLQTKDTVLLYWSLLCDEEGYPFSTRNHQDAVSAFIVWKLYSQKVFLGIGNSNANINYKDEYEVLCLASRGNDAWPTIEQWTEIGVLSYSDRRELIMHPPAYYNYCNDDLPAEEGPVIPDPIPGNRTFDNTFDNTFN